MCVSFIHETDFFFASAVQTYNRKVFFATYGSAYIKFTLEVVQTDHEYFYVTRMRRAKDTPLYVYSYSNTTIYVAVIFALGG